MTNELFICASVRPLLRAHRLDDFAILLTGVVGELLSSGIGGRELRRLTLDDPESSTQFYLKRLGREPVMRLLRGYLSGHRPRSGPLRELAALQQLRAAGFATMMPVAWGERRCLGLPVAGFLLVKSVPGNDGATLFDTLQGEARMALLEEVGELVGRLHAAGFFHVVRLKDLILDSQSGVLTLIDRETSKPWPARFAAHRATASLARAARRTTRDGHRFGPAALRRFLVGYARGVDGVWDVSTDDLRYMVLDGLRREMKGLPSKIGRKGERDGGACALSP